MNELMMTVKRKVRKDFDLTKEYSVDVEDCTDKEKEEVQQAFFDVGIMWGIHGNLCCCLGAVKYSNALDGRIVGVLVGDASIEGCNMTAKEFLELVYEPE